MGQRHELYYYVVHEVLIKRNERQAIIDLIREGKVQLVYDLTEFASLDLEDCEYTVQDTVLVRLYYYYPFNICNIAYYGVNCFAYTFQVDHLMDLTGAKVAFKAYHLFIFPASKEQMILLVDGVLVMLEFCVSSIAYDTFLKQLFCHGLVCLP